MEYIKKVTQEIINKILSKGVKDMPQNPSAQGLTAAQIREFYYAPEKMTLELIAEIENAVAEAFNQIPTNDGYSKEDIDRIVNGITEQIANRYTKEETYSAKQIDEKIANVGGGGGGTSTDVQINGASITENGVANIPYASGDKAGLFKSNADSGIFIDGNSGSGSIVAATNAAIDAKTQKFQPIVPANLDYAVKKGLIGSANKAQTDTNFELGDADKESVRDWLGAMPNSIAKQRNFGDGYTPSFNDAGALLYSRIIGGSSGNVNVLQYSIPFRDENGVLYGQIPTTDYGLTPKKYIDDLFASGGGGSGSGTKLYLHQVPIHFTGFVDAGVPEFTLILNVLSSQSTAYGSGTSFETLVNATFNKIVSLTFVAKDVQFRDVIASTFIVSYGAWTLRYIQSVTQTEYILQGPEDYEGHKLEIMTYTPTLL